MFKCGDEVDANQGAPSQLASLWIDEFLDYWNGSNTTTVNMGEYTYFVEKSYNYAGSRKFQFSSSCPVEIKYTNVYCIEMLLKEHTKGITCVQHNDAAILFHYLNQMMLSLEGKVHSLVRWLRSVLFQMVANHDALLHNRAKNVICNDLLERDASAIVIRYFTLVDCVKSRIRRICTISKADSSKKWTPEEEKAEAAAEQLCSFFCSLLHCVDANADWVPAPDVVDKAVSHCKEFRETRLKKRHDLEDIVIVVLQLVNKRMSDLQ